MTEHGDNLFGFALLDQRIVDDNVLFPWKSVEVGIAVGTALAAVNNVQLMERELKTLRQIFDAGLQSTGFERRQLVEQGQDDDRVDGDGEDLDEHAKQPQIVEERVAGLLDDLEHGADNRRTQHDPQHLALEQVRDPQLQRLFVETEFLLENERVVIRDWQRQDRRNDIEREDEQQRLRNLALEPCWEVPRQKQTADSPQLGKDIAVDENQILDLAVETGDEAEFGLCAPVRLTLVKDLLRYLGFQDLWRLRPLQHLVLSEGEQAFEDELAERKSDEHRLPWEEWAV